jgi:flagellar biosynthetic protein FlhB
MEDNKPLPATEKKRAEAREKGQVARSMDLNAVILLATGLGLLLFAGPRLAAAFASTMRRSFEAISASGTSANVPAHPSLWIDTSILFPMLGVFTGLVLAVAGVQFWQVGFLISDKPLEPKPEKLNPVNGLKNMFGLRKVVASVLSLLKIVVITGFALLAVRELRNHDVFARPVQPGELGSFLLDATWQLGWRVLIALAVLAVIDFYYQRFQFEKDLRMSFTEVKEEMKKSEGSPEAKGRRKAAARKLFFKSFRRQIEDMADATIVITNPTHFAVALRYVRGDTPAPVVIAKGQDRNALRMRERAAELGVPMIENKPLARGLYKHAKVGGTIPTLYYQAVAGVLAELYRRGIRPRSSGS